MLVNKIKNRQASFTTNPLQQQPPAPGTAEHVLPMQYHQIAVEAAPVATDHIIQASPVLYRNDPTAANPAAYRQIHQPVYAPVQAPAVTYSKMSHAGDSSDDETYRIHGGSVSSEGSRPTSPTPHEILLMPPRDVQLIIDKMASYVAKNGRDFEAIVRSKGDSRFSFLDANHAYFSYYQHKVGMYEKLEAPAKPVPANNMSGRMDVDDSSQDMSVAAGVAGDDSRDGSERSSDGSKNETKPRPKPAPVCFSIKKPKESEGMLLEKRSALPIEESTDEEEGQEGEEKEKKEKEKKSEEKKKIEETSAKDEGKTKDRTETETESSRPSNSGHSEESTSLKNTSVKEVKEKKGTVDKDKWAEERVKDKLAAAAREKIAAAAREKQLQLERKRRAAAFINMIRKDHPLGTPERTVVGPLLPDGTPVQRLTDDEGEVSSVPSPTSFSDVTSPQHVGNGTQDVEDRLNPKENGEAMPQTTSLFARIQASKQNVKRRHSDSDSGSNHSRSRSRSHSHSQSQSRGTDRHRHKRKKSSSSTHKRPQPLPSPHAHIRSHRHRKEEELLKSRKSKKKTRSRSRSRSKSHLTKLHHHSSSEKSGSRTRHESVDHHSNRKIHHKKSKKSSRSSDRRSSSHTSNSS